MLKRKLPKCSVPGCKNPGTWSSALNKETDKLMDFCKPCTLKIRKLISKRIPIKIELQVNMHFDKTHISGCGSIERGEELEGVCLFAPNLPSLLRKIRKKFGAKLEDITLTFQPE
jgi:hypothetical protein